MTSGPTLKSTGYIIFVNCIELSETLSLSMWLLSGMITSKNTGYSIQRIPEWLFVALPVVATFIVWFGTTHSGFTPDDYMVIDVQSPIRSFVDAISMFWRNDPNPQYWRPFTNSTVSLDFWLWGWNGGMFHLTNLILHCVALCLIFYFVRRILSFSAFSAGILVFLFGVSGSHDSNLLWIAARSDVVATIMMLLVLLTAFKAEASKGKKIPWLTLSYLSFFLALSSKEVSGVVIVLLPLLIYTSSLKELWKKKKQAFINLLPYIILTGLFIYIRLQFTVPLSEMQPLTAEGSHSVIAFAKNFIYSLGYILAPIDFRSASLIINRFAVIGYVAAIFFFTGLVLLIKLSGGKKALELMYKPLILTFITGFVSFQSFERWRIYFPSVGVLALLVILFTLWWNKLKSQQMARPILIAIPICFAIFHIHQSLEAQSVWEKATAQLKAFGADLQKTLVAHQKRPIGIELLTSPTKLGGAPMLQLSKTYLAIKAEADLRNLPALRYGVVSIPGDSVSFDTDLDTYALDPERGFQSLVFKKNNAKEYEVSANKDEIGLFPNAEIEGGKARRDEKLLPGQKYETFGTTITIQNAEASFASHLKMLLHDTSSVHLFFDGRSIKELW